MRHSFIGMNASALRIYWMVAGWESANKQTKPDGTSVSVGNGVSLTRSLIIYLFWCMCIVCAIPHCHITAYHNSKQSTKHKNTKTQITKSLSLLQRRGPLSSVVVCCVYLMPRSFVCVLRACRSLSCLRLRRVVVWCVVWWSEQLVECNAAASFFVPAQHTPIHSLRICLCTSVIFLSLCRYLSLSSFLESENPQTRSYLDVS